ncbi:uncharacterized protein LOC114325584 [Diabrotica virgifera virgifera]|uniref:LRRCT domain-containing protein n=1 Tax=Diabrotica virgifera virgifera TaxID=50390 RepID=A0ABM5IBY9_DIAVI|nr:uncharacterized protein LOC114325584 [Diabrotica virgifera virgifera]
MYDLILKKNKNDNDKWRGVVITVTCIFFCICVAIIVLDNTLGIFDLDSPKIKNCSTEHGRRKISKPKLSNFKLKETDGRCYVSIQSEGCAITCDGATVQDILKSDVDNCGGRNVILTLKGLSIPNGKLEEGWLNGFPLSVTSLQISESVDDLGDRVFSGVPFQILSVLILDNTNLSQLKKNILEGSKLKRMEFRFIDTRQVDFEWGLLQPVASSLEILQIQRCYLEAEDIINLTGTGTTLQIVELDMMYNSIEYLKSNSFIDIPRVVQLYLTDCNIKYVEKDAFSGIGHALNLFSINKNSLSTLPKGIFSGFQATSSNFGIYDISDNPWICDCDLLWLKEFYITHKGIYFGGGQIPFLCHTDEGAQDYTKVDFCPSKTTTTTSTTLTTSTTSTTLKPTTQKVITPQPTRLTSTKTSNEITTEKLTSLPSKSTSTISVTFSNPTTDKTTTTQAQPVDPTEYISITCDDCTRKMYKSSTINRIYSHTLSVRNGSITYDFYELEGTPNYEITLHNSVDNEYMIWFNVDQHDERGCEYNIKEVVNLQRLSFSQRYILCLLRKNESTVSPFDCTSLVVPPEWSEKTWIFNKDKVLLIVMYVITLVIIVTITVLIVYCIIKRHPKLIKSNKKLTEEEDGIFNSNQSFPSVNSLYSTSNGYLSPRILTRRWSSRKLSTISEKDYEGSFNAVYNVTEGHLYEAPPLPPNHPSRWRKLECENEFFPSSLYLNRRNSFINEIRHPVSPALDNVRSKSLPEENSRYIAFHLSK